MGQWDKAAADYIKVVELVPEDDLSWLRAAPLLVLAGDVEGYREHCRKMLHQFRQSDSASTAERTSKVCLLLPGAVDDSKLPRRTFESALDDGSAPNWFYGWGFAARALAAYRAGDAEKTAAWIRKSQGTETYATNPSLQALALLLLAMAQHQLEQLEDARRSLAQANELVDEHLPKFTDRDLEDAWDDWLIAEILRREATELIAGPTEHSTPKTKTTPTPRTE